MSRIATDAIVTPVELQLTRNTVQNVMAQIRSQMESEARAGVTQIARLPGGERVRPTFTRTEEIYGRGGRIFQATTKTGTTVPLGDIPDINNISQDVIRSVMNIKDVTQRIERETARARQQAERILSRQQANDERVLEQQGRRVDKDRNRKIRSDQRESNRLDREDEERMRTAQFAARERQRVTRREVGNIVSSAANMDRENERNRREQRSAQRRQIIDQRRQFANNMLTVSSAGLGLFGAAGFPLLNVGFAAMSGNVLGASVAALTTGFGEAVRAMNAFADKTAGIARGIGFVSTDLKLAEAGNQGFNAFMGGGALLAEQSALQLQMERMRRSGLGGAGFNLNSMWGSMREGMSTTWGRALSEGRFPSSMAYLEDVSDIADRSGKNRSAFLQSALQNAINAQNRTSVGIETDPYLSWMRQQNAALDSSKSEEMRLQEELIKTLKELVDAEKEKTKPMTWGGALREAFRNQIPFGRDIF